MPHVTVVERSGAVRIIEAAREQSLMEAIRSAEIEEMLALCGGCCCCGTCHVYVDVPGPDALPPVGEDEDDLLDWSVHRRPTSRLSCQIPMKDAPEGLRVTIAPYG
jgi:2Fe-2S ferredoxin